MNLPTPSYSLIDSGDFQKLEQIGPYRVVRPAAQAVWRPRLGADVWQNVDAVFSRFSGGEGRWEVRQRRLPASWTIEAGLGEAWDSASASETLKLVLRLTDFGHLGIFPEQHANWQRLAAMVAARKAAGQVTKVLNLFAYTGGSTLACAAAGAEVAHLDASKTSVAWAKENAAASGLGDRPVRWLVDDVVKFVAREVRREQRYDGLILDPPSYGRGPKGESWKIEEMLPPLLDGLRALLAPHPAFVLLSSHSTGYTPLALTNLTREVFAGAFDSPTITAAEMVVSEVGDGGRPLPSGASCLIAQATRRSGP